MTEEMGLMSEDREISGAATQRKGGGGGDENVCGGVVHASSTPFSC